MERSKVLKLAETVWLAPIEKHPDFEIAVVPARLADVVQTLFAGWSTILVERVVREGFLDFKGYTENGKPLENTIATRRELLDIPEVRLAIQAEVMRASKELSEGEPVAGSV